MSNVIPFVAKNPDPAPAVTCRCCEHQTCYPHRVARVVENLRTAVAGFDDWLLLRSDVEAIAGAALDELEAIVDECLPDERTAR